MNWDKAIELLENGEARLVVTETLILSYNGKVYVGFDGKEWEETDSEFIKKQLE